jgi:hypothetical protein
MPIFEQVWAEMRPNAIGPYQQLSDIYSFHNLKDEEYDHYLYWM